eukprot:TRINITY_DN25358_c0_g2_i1.p1 TRINITY_DN25358_c0_g2~~TRINITY_DN25358_c0_g2_i1.p1  ORF type:complete len:654 (-),score=109.55 TRINITY_DN25358_c0_g2_i1:82-1986(-)
MAAKLSEWLRKLRGDTEVEGVNDQKGKQDEPDWDDDSDDSTVSTVYSEEIRQKELLSRQEGANRGKNLKPDPDLFTDELWFCSIVAAICSLNLLCLGLEADYACKGHGCVQQDYMVWQAFHYMFTTLFVIEMAIRIGNAGVRRYFLGEKHKATPSLICGIEVRLRLQCLHLADFIIVFLGTIDILFMAHAGNMPTLYRYTVFRILHLAPCARHLQLSQSFRELWLVISALGETMRTLTYVIVMLVLVTWVAAILVTIAVQEHKAEEFYLGRSQWTFDDYWGTVLKTGNSLLQFMTRDKWGDSLVFPLVDRSKSFIAIFVIFYVIAGMALMNAIVAVVIECTLATSRQTQEQDKRKEEQVDNHIMASLHQIFHDADEDGNGEMSKDELLSMLRKPRVRDRLYMLQIPFMDLDMLFDLFDTAEMDGVGTRGSISCDKFFRGVSKLRGPARSADLHQMSIDLSRACFTCSDNISVLAQSNDVLAGVLDSINETDIAIFQADVDKKDPALVDRRKRGVKKISDEVRAPFMGLRVNPDIYNPWDQFPKDSCSPQSKETVKPDHAVLDVKNLTPPKASHRAKKEAAPPPAAPTPKPNAPPPPPLPEHLRYLEESQDTVAKAPKKARVKGRIKLKSSYEFD